MPQKKYPLELRERAVRMVLDALEADPGARRGIFRRIGDQLGVNPETLRWDC
jgi:transposase